MKIKVTRKPLPENSIWRKKNLSLAAICWSLSIAFQVMVLISQFPIYSLIFGAISGFLAWVFVVKSLKPQ